MLKTNSKAVRGKVRAWIMENTTFEGYDELQNVDTSNFAEVARALLDTCEKEKFYCRYATVQGMMLDWFQGLPSVLDTAHYIYHCNAVNLLGGWLEETEAEKARFSESQAENMINVLIIREILKGVREA